jgi:phosphopantothenoylcysteine synthetase/decarboxylase
MPLRPPLHCLITAGPTREHLDPVRFISNPSSGKMGYAIAQAALDLGWTVDLVSGPVSLKPPPGVAFHPVVSGNDMLEKCQLLFPSCHVLIKCAAVSDMRPVVVHSHKQKKDQIAWSVDFEPVPDILKTLSAARKEQILVGFAAETQDIESYAKRKLMEKNLHWIVANDVGGNSSAFGSDNNSVSLLSREHATQYYGPASKPQVARWLLTTIAALS